MKSTGEQRAIVITAAGSPEVLLPLQRDIPTPLSGEVLIKVQAAGVNRHDCNQRRAGPDHAKTDIPGLEVAGTILEVATDVREYSGGENVCALVDGGGYAQFAVAPAALTFPIPAGLDFITAAGLPEALFTAWYNFFELGRLQPTEKSLIHGGTSGIGSLAIQALTSLGYSVYATCGSAEKCRAAVSLGARDAFDYHHVDLAGEIMRSTRGRGVDVILDMSAGAHLPADLQVIAPPWPDPAFVGRRREDARASAFHGNGATSVGHGVALAAAAT